MHDENPVDRVHANVDGVWISTREGGTLPMLSEGRERKGRVPSFGSRLERSREERVELRMDEERECGARGLSLQFNPTCLMLVI